MQEGWRCGISRRWEAGKEKEMLWVDEIPTTENWGLHLHFDSKYNGPRHKILKSLRV